MAKFVTEASFDILDASQDMFTSFVVGFSGEETGTDVVGFDGETYGDFFVVLGQAGEARLSLGGDFDLSGVPAGTVEYLSVSYGGSFQFYISELSADLGTIVPLLMSPVTPGTVHSALLLALSGDDEINLPGDTNVFDGGAGTDTVTYDGARADFAVSQGEDGGLDVVSTTVTARTDSLDNVERLTFDDGSLIFDLDGENASFAYRIYAAAYGRTPDEAGLRFWTDVLDQRVEGTPGEADKEFLASFFLTANEFIDLYGENPSNEAYINALYENVLNREADQSGYDFWLGQIESGQGRDDLLIWFTDSVENLENTAPDFDDGIWVL